MNWNWRVIVVVPAASLAVAEQAARAINSGGPDYTGNAFSVSLSASGSEPPSHFGLYTSATDEMVSQMASALPAIAGVMYWRHDLNGVLVASNVTPPNGQQWGMQQSLDAAVLRLIPLPTPIPEGDTFQVNVVNPRFGQ